VRESPLDLLGRLDPRQTLRQVLDSQTRALDSSLWIQEECRRLQEMGHLEGLGIDPGTELVAGADEVGRGPMAGPLVAAAVAFRSVPWLPGLRDSKKLKPAHREALVPWIHCQAVSWSVYVVPVEVLNQPMGTIHSHSLEAMRECVGRLNPEPDRLLVDGRFPLEGLDLPQRAVVHGDDLCLAVAAASVLAKVQRDQIMCELDRLWPGYGFARNKGYCTADHLEALERLGPCPVHRLRFGPVRASLASPEAVQGMLDLED
jgi:ribonuclease HII